MLEKKVVYKKDDEIIEQFIGEEEDSWWHAFAELHGIEIVEFKMEENPDAYVPPLTKEEKLQQELDELKMETAESNAELFEMILMMGVL